MILEGQPFIDQVLMMYVMNVTFRPSSHSHTYDDTSGSNGSEVTSCCVKFKLNRVPYLTIHLMYFVGASQA